jgi:hypothetical protein
MSKNEMLEVRDVAQLPNGTFSVTIPLRLFKKLYNSLPVGFKVIFAEHGDRLYAIFVSPVESVDEYVHNLQNPSDEEQRGHADDPWVQRYLKLMQDRPSYIPAPVNTRPPTPEELAEQHEPPPLREGEELSPDGRYTTYYNRPSKKEHD